MLNFEKELKIILKEDPLNILIIKPNNPPITSNQRLIESFKEINDFIKKEGKEPSVSDDIHERKLLLRVLLAL